MNKDIKIRLRTEFFKNDSSRHAFDCDESCSCRQPGYFLFKPIDGEISGRLFSVFSEKAITGSQLNMLKDFFKEVGLSIELIIDSCNLQYFYPELNRLGIKYSNITPINSITIALE